MHCSEDALRPLKRSRTEFHGAEASEASLLDDVDLVDSLADSLADGLADGLVGSDLGDGSDCMLQMLLEGFGVPCDVDDATIAAPYPAEVHHKEDVTIVPSPTFGVSPDAAAGNTGLNPGAAAAAAGAPAASATHAPSLLAVAAEAFPAGSRRAAPAAGTFMPTPTVTGTALMPAPADGATQSTAQPSVQLSQPAASLLRKRLVPFMEPSRTSSGRTGPQARPAGSGSAAGARPAGSGSPLGAWPAGSGPATGARPARSGSGAGARPAGSGSAAGARPAGPGSGAGARPAGSGSAAGIRPAGSGSAAGPWPVGSGSGAGIRPAGSGSAAGPRLVGCGSAGRPSYQKTVDGKGQAARVAGGAAAVRGGGLDDSDGSGELDELGHARPTAKHGLKSSGPRGSGAAVPASGGAAHSSNSSNLLLRVFNGLMRDEVATLAVAAAQRACVTAASVPPGLYFTKAAVAADPECPAKAPKRGGKEKQFGGAAGAAASTAEPFARYYPEADAELMSALYGKRPLPRRVRVEQITDRCHPCFRNPYEGLAAVKERRKVAANGSLPEGCLLGPYTGELRAGKLDERIVGGDLSGVEGLKAAFTLTLISDLGPQAAPEQARDSLVVVGDPATCALAETNAPRSWGSCPDPKPATDGTGSRTACNCKSYKGRRDNAAVIPCVLKVRLSRLRAAAEAMGESAALKEGLEVLRAAAAAVSGPGTSRDDQDLSYVYGIVTVVVTSEPLKDGDEVLLRWDSDDSFFAVAEQNLRQYQYIRTLTSERAELEAQLGEQRRRMGLLRRAHRESQAAREGAVQQRDEAVQQRDEAVQQRDEALQQRGEAERKLDEAVRQRDDAVRNREDAVEDVRGQRVAAAAVAAAAGPRVTKLEALVAELQAERHALATQVEQLKDVQRQQQQEQQQDEVGVGAFQQTQARKGLQQEEVEPSVGVHSAAECRRLRAECDRLAAQRDTAVRRCSDLVRRCGAAVGDRMPIGAEVAVGSAHKRPRLDEVAGERDCSGGGGSEFDSELLTAIGNGDAERPDGPAALATYAVPLSVTGIGNSDDDGGGPSPGLILQRYAAAKRKQDEAVSELAAKLERQGAARQRHAGRLEDELAATRQQLQAATEAAGGFSARLSELELELAANRSRTSQLELQLAAAATVSFNSKVGGSAGAARAEGAAAPSRDQ